MQEVHRWKFKCLHGQITVVRPLGCRVQILVQLALLGASFYLPDLHENIFRQNVRQTKIKVRVEPRSKA